MKTYIKRDLLDTIKNNPHNAEFFRASKFFHDKSYTVLNIEWKGQIFAVKHEYGVAYYKLNGSNIGNYTNII